HDASAGRDDPKRDPGRPKLPREELGRAEFLAARFRMRVEMPPDPPQFVREGTQVPVDGLSPLAHAGLRSFGSVRRRSPRQRGFQAVLLGFRREEGLPSWSSPVDSSSATEGARIVGPLVVVALAVWLDPNVPAVSAWAGSAAACMA